MPTIEALLLESHSTLGDFLSAIEAERQCLGGDVAALPETTQRKSALAARLAALEAQRDAALVAKGFAAGRTGVESWLASLPGASGTGPRSTWISLLESAAKAKRDNELNGQLIAARLQQTQQALGVLLDETADASTYGADGQRSSGTGRRNLGSA